ncbi:hypothetical protein ACLOJK_035337 [Asimina triloba]
MEWDVGEDAARARVLMPLDLEGRGVGRWQICRRRWMDARVAGGCGGCWLGRKGWPTLEKKGQRSSVLEGSDSACHPLHFGWLGSTVLASRWSSPPAAMAAGLGEGDGAPYGCSGDAP